MMSGAACTARQGPRGQGPRGAQTCPVQGGVARFRTAQAGGGARGARGARGRGASARADLPATSDSTTPIQTVDLPPPASPGPHVPGSAAQRQPENASHAAGDSCRPHTLWHVMSSPIADERSTVRRERRARSTTPPALHAPGAFTAPPSLSGPPLLCAEDEIFERLQIARTEAHEPFAPLFFVCETPNGRAGASSPRARGGGGGGGGWAVRGGAARSGDPAPPGAAWRRAQRAGAGGPRCRGPAPAAGAQRGAPA